MKEADGKAAAGLRSRNVISSNQLLFPIWLILTTNVHLSILWPNFGNSFMVTYSLVTNSCLERYMFSVKFAILQYGRFNNR